MKLLARLWARLWCALGRHPVVDILESGPDHVAHCPDCGASWTLADADALEVKH